MTRSRFVSTVFQAILLSFAILCFASLPAFADTVFTDGTFNLTANYTVTGPYTSATAPATTSISSGQCATCGNGGGFGLLYNQTSTDLGIASGDGGYTNNTFTYNPTTQGAITSLSASVDKDFSVSGFNSSASAAVSAGDYSFGNSFRPMIFQDGTYYVYDVASSGILGTGFTIDYSGTGTTGDTTGYETIAAGGLVASDFVAFNFATDTFGTANPNFAGDTMTFGLAEIVSFDDTGCTGGSCQINQDFVADFDNLSFDIGTPEPSSLLLLALGLAGLLGLIGTGALKRRAVV